YARIAEPPEHRRYPRFGRVRRRSLPDPGASAGADAVAAARGRAIAPGGGALRLPPNCRGTGSRPRKGHRPPRPEAGEREDHARRKGEGAGFRVGEGARTALIG